MNIFQQEINDGLKEALENNLSIAYLSILESHIKPKDIETAIASVEVKDFASLDSILASTGENSNTDVFDPYELYKARKTPIHKKLDFNHDESDVIGTITDSYMIDAAGEMINDNIEVENLPENFHIFNKSIIWTFWKDNNLKERIKTLLSEIANGEWAVSMECIFPSFDYYVKKPDGTNIILPRTEKTAFLTKHLRQYGGKGEYQGYGLGRLMRDIVFVGKGVTKTPANQSSVILSIASNQPYVKCDKVDFYDFSKSSVYDNVNQKEENSMADKNEEVQLAEANKQIAQLTEKNNKLELLLQEYSEAKFKNLEVKLETAEASLQEKETKISATEQAIADIQKKLQDAKAENEALLKEKAEQALAMKKKDRAMALAQAGLTEEEATAKAEKFLNADEEVFNEYVEAIKAKTKAMCKDDEEKEAKASTEVEEAAASVVEETKSDETVPQETSSDEVVTLQEKLQQAIASKLYTTKPNKKNGE